MKTIPKPKYCGQEWLEMTPIKGGRICGQCHKSIIDFSKMSWKEIEQLQGEKYNSACGMYSSKQLENWGREIPKAKDNIIRFATITSICIAFTGTANAQADSLLFKGRVIDRTTKEPLPFALVTLKNLKDTSQTDFDGNFKFTIKNLPSEPYKDTIEVNYLGYLPLLVTFDDLNSIKDTNAKPSLNNFELGLMPNPDIESTAFYVEEPTIGNRIKWKLRRWFGW